MSQTVADALPGGLRVAEVDSVSPTPVTVATASSQSLMTTTGRPATRWDVVKKGVRFTPQEFLPDTKD